MSGMFDLWGAAYEEECEKLTGYRKGGLFWRANCSALFRDQAQETWALE
jgi:hypothetical protein